MSNLRTFLSLLFVVFVLVAIGAAVFIFKARLKTIVVKNELDRINQNKAEVPQ
jgi:uncharacterized membrane protein YciS (DUF1049 family)